MVRETIGAIVLSARSDPSSVHRHCSPASMLHLLVLCSVFCYVASQKGCCPPNQWEGRASELSSLEGVEGVYTDSVLFSHDYTRKLAAEMFYFKFEGRIRQTGYIFDFAKKRGYQFDPLRQSCFTFAITTPAYRFCIKDGTYSTPDSYIGAIPNRIKTRSFFIRQPNTKYNVTSTVSWDKPQCIPIRDLSSGSRGTVRFVNSVLFTDITMGIKDPSVFTPPAYCLKTFEAEHQETGHFLVDYLHNKFME